MNIEWIQIAASISEIPFQSNNMCVIDVKDTKITLVNYQNQLYAIAYKCPHASGIMANGFIDGIGNAVCPLHRYKFNIKNGRNTTGEGYYLKTYSVDVNEQGVFVALTKQSIWLVFNT
ncbi:MAG: Rieske (2Fe-2S) protein [Chitinophagaceae bacterium]